MMPPSFPSIPPSIHHLSLYPLVGSPIPKCVLLDGGRKQQHTHTDAGRTCKKGPWLQGDSDPCSCYSLLAPWMCRVNLFFFWLCVCQGGGFKTEILFCSNDLNLPEEQVHRGTTQMLQRLTHSDGKNVLKSVSYRRKTTFILTKRWLRYKTRTFESCSFFLIFNTFVSWNKHTLITTNEGKTVNVSSETGPLWLVPVSKHSRRLCENFTSAGSAQWGDFKDLHPEL